MQECALVRHYRETGDLEARNELWMGHYRYAKSFVSQYLKVRPQISREKKPELISEALWALLGAIENDKFNPWRFRLTTFATPYMKRHVRDYTRVKGSVKFPPGALSSGFTDVIVPDPDAIVDEHSCPPEDLSHLSQELKAAFQTLPHLERLVLQWIFFDGGTVAALSRTLQIGRTRIYRLRKQALDRLRLIFAGKNIPFPLQPWQACPETHQQAVSV